MQISVKTVYSKKHKIRCRLERALRSRPGSPPRPPRSEPAGPRRAAGFSRQIFVAERTLAYMSPYWHERRPAPRIPVSVYL